MKAKYSLYGIQFFAFIFLMHFSSVVLAQSHKKGELIVTKDSLINILQEVRLGVYKPSSTGGNNSSNTTVDRGSGTRTTMTGFRVQVYLGSSRNEAYAEQARFKRMFRDIETYISYEEPNYRVKVGDFKSRSEAQKLMQGLRSQFSNVFIFTETIYVYH